MSQTNQGKLFKILAEVAKVKPEQIAPDVELKALGLESVDIAEIMFEIEDKFLIEFPEESDITKRFDGLKTVGDLLNIVNTLVAEKEAS